MQLERGPIADLGELAIEHIPPDTTFLQLAIDAERENGATDDQIGLLVDGAFAALAQDVRGDTEQELWDSQSGLERQTQGDLGDGWEDINTAGDESDELMLTAYKNVPAESFAPVPDPVQEPANPPTFDPSPSPDDTQQIP